MMLNTALGRQPFKRVEGELRFEPLPTLPATFFFTKKASDGFEKERLF